MFKSLILFLCLSSSLCCAKDKCCCSRLEIVESYSSNFFYNDIQLVLIKDTQKISYLAYLIQTSKDWDDPIEIVMRAIPIPWKNAKRMFPEYLKNRDEYILTEQLEGRYVNFVTNVIDNHKGPDEFDFL